MVDKIDHIGVAVNNIEQQLKYYKDVLKLELEKIDSLSY
jgi:catechol 2,3-dioxygenase-like lactoylglutathione lyase family enzyme